MPDLTQGNCKECGERVMVIVLGIVLAVIAAILVIAGVGLLANTPDAAEGGQRISPASWKARIASGKAIGDAPEAEDPSDQSVYFVNHAPANLTASRCGVYRVRRAFRRLGGR